MIEVNEGVRVAKARKPAAEPEVHFSQLLRGDWYADMRARDPEMFRAMSEVWAASGTDDGPAAMRSLGALLDRRARLGAAAALLEPVELVRVKNGPEIAYYSDDLGTADLRRHVEIGTTQVLEKSTLSGRTESRRVRRAVTLLDRFLREEEISERMKEAGDDFARAFSMAHLHGAKAANLERIPGGAGGGMADRVIDARNRVWRSLERLGGWSTPLGQAAYWVLGYGRSLRQHAETQPGMRHDTVKGLVIGALSVWAGERKRP